MKKDPVHPFRLLSALLVYPDHDLLGQIEMIETEVDDMPSKKMKKSMDDFLLYLKTHSPIHLQEGYTAAFDMNPSTTLNLTYHSMVTTKKGRMCWRVCSSATRMPAMNVPQGSCRIIFR